MTRPDAPRAKDVVIDCDAHHSLDSYAQLQPYLDEPWRSIVNDPASRPGGNGYRAYRGHHRRDDAYPPGGGKPGSDPDFMYRQLIEDTGIDIAVLTGDLFAVNVIPNADYGNALVSASNDWTYEHWLRRYPEYRGSICVNSEDPVAAAQEIERVGDRPEFCQVLMSATSTRPYGNRFYHPIYEAARHHCLPVAIHAGAAGTGLSQSVTAMGRPTSYFEYHTGLAGYHQTHVISLVCEGVFEKFPTLKWICIEGGVSWIAPLMWRLDKNWKALRGETPWVKRAPSEYVKDHIRFTTQPMEEPARPEHLLQMYEMIDAERTVMYSSDYPHWDFDPPTVLSRLPKNLQKRILSETARETLRLS